MTWGRLSLALAAALLGCARGEPPASAPSNALASAEDEQALEADEKRALEWMAVANPRFARRLAAPPSEDQLRTAVLKALAEGDADVSVRDGRLDFFSFVARARGLDQAAKALGGETRRQPIPCKQGGGVALVQPVPCRGGAGLERELVGRIVAEERARLDEERSLPAGASALVRGIVETWTPLPSPEAAAERDEWLGRKLDQIRSSLAGSALPRGGLLELDDALDPLERIAVPEELPSSAQAIARLRVSLGETPPASGPDEARRGRIEAGVRAHLGLAIDAKEIRARLERAEGATRAMAKEAVSHADERAVSRRAQELTLALGRCEASPSASGVRAMAPPAERAAICGSLRALHEAADEVSHAAALVALHDETVVALWALALHADAVTPERAIASAHPFFGAQPEREARLIRFAEARPVAAIGAGLAANLLTRAGTASAADVRAAGELWLSFGDAPLDVIERELFSSGSPPPASPPP